MDDIVRQLAKAIALSFVIVYVAFLFCHVLAAAFVVLGILMICKIIPGTLFHGLITLAGGLVIAWVLGCVWWDSRPRRAEPIR